MKINRSLLKVLAAVLVLGAGAVTALAHHSIAMYDTSKRVSITGTIKTVQWTNPHVMVWVYDESRAGETPQLWSLELTSPGNLTRAGWTKRSLNPGDKVTVEMSTLKDGSKGKGLFRRATLASGQVLSFSFADLEKSGIGF